MVKCGYIGLFKYSNKKTASYLGAKTFLRFSVVNIKSHAISIDENTKLQRYGFVETRFLVFLCNHLRAKQNELHQDEFEDYLNGLVSLDIQDLSKQLFIHDKDSRRIFSHANQVFNKGIDTNEEGLWIQYSEYWNGKINIILSDEFKALVEDGNPYLFNFDIALIRYINCVSAIRFLNYLFAQKLHTVAHSELTLNLEQIRTIFGVENSYTCLSNIRSKVIGKSVNMINQFTKFKIKVKRKPAVVENLNYTFVIDASL